MLLRSLALLAVLTTSQLAAADDGNALSLETARAKLAAVPDPGNCAIVAFTGTPFAIQHLHDKNLTQTAAPVRFALYASAGVTRSDGTVVATIVGQLPTGEVLGNHHLVSDKGGFRTLNDVIAMTPTADKCVMKATAKLNFHDGTGVFAGLRGAGVAEATLNLCGPATFLCMWTGRDPVGFARFATE